MVVCVSVRAWSLVTVSPWEKLFCQSILLFVHYFVDVLASCLILLLHIFVPIRNRKSPVFSFPYTEACMQIVLLEVLVRCEDRLQNEFVEIFFKDFLRLAFAEHAHVHGSEQLPYCILAHQRWVRHQVVLSLECLTRSLVIFLGEHPILLPVNAVNHLCIGVWDV